MQRQVEATPFTPRHVCTLVVPSLSGIKGTSTISLELPKNNSSEPRCQTPDSSNEEQQFGSFTSISSTGTTRTNSNNTVAKSLSPSGSNVTPIVANTSTTFRHISSSITVASSLSNSSIQQNVLRSQSSNSSLASQKQHYGSNPIPSPITSSSSSLLNKRPGSIGSLSTSANPQTSSQMKIVFGQYLLVPTMDALVLIYQIIDYYHAQQSLLEVELQSHSTDTNVKLNTFNDIDGHQARIENIRAKATKMEQEKGAVEPIYSLGPFYIGNYDFGHKKKYQDEQNIPATIIAVDDISISSKKSQLQQYVVILTNEGDVHVLRFHISSQSSSNQHHRKRGRKDELQVEHISSFYTGNLGATCLKVFKPKLNNDDTLQRDDGKDMSNNSNEKINSFERILQMTIGHDNGVITCFEIIQSKNNNNYIHVLKWIGNFHENSSILSLSCIGDDEDDNIHDNDDTLSFHHQYLIVAMGQYPIDDFDPTTATKSNMTQCLEVVNISLLEKDWKGRYFGPESDSSFPMMADYDTLVHSCSLDNFTVWPMREMLNDDADCIFVRESSNKKKNASHKKGNKIRSRKTMYGVNIVGKFCLTSILERFYQLFDSNPFHPI